MKNKQNQIKKCVAVIQDFQRFLFILAHPILPLSFSFNSLSLSFSLFSLPYNTFHKNNLNLCKDRLVKHTKQQSGHHGEVYLVLPDHWSVATRYRTTDESHTDVLWGVCPHGWVVAIDYPVFYTPPFRDFCCCHRWRESSWGWNQEKILQLQHKRWRSTAI